MKKMIVLLATLMMAMSVSAWAADVAPAKAEDAAPVNKGIAKPTKTHKKSAEKMRGCNSTATNGMSDCQIQAPGERKSPDVVQSTSPSGNNSGRTIRK